MRWATDPPPAAPRHRNNGIGAQGDLDNDPDDDIEAPAVEAPAAGKRGRPARDTQTEKQRSEAEKKRKRRKCFKAYQFVAMICACLGGTAGCTWFFVNMLRCALVRTKTLRKYVFLQNDVHKQILDDPELFAAFRKEMDKRRKPALSAFITARLTGVTIKGMDSLRFATIWTPGHGTLSAAMKDLENNLEANWCPSGPKTCWGTTRTEEEQRAGEGIDTPEDVVGEEEEEEEELAADVEAEIDAEAAAGEAERDVEWQALSLLAREFPEESEKERWKRWAGGMDAEGVLSGCNVLQVCAMRDGALLGFIKVLITSVEVFVDELLVGESARGLGLSWWLINHVLVHVKRRQLRLQARKDNGHAIRIYTGDPVGWRMVPWKIRTTGPFGGPDPVRASPEATHVMFESTCARTRAAVEAFLEGKAESWGARMELRCFAAYPIDGMHLDSVGVETFHAAEQEDVEMAVQEDVEMAEQEDADEASDERTEEEKNEGALGAFHDDPEDCNDLDDELANPTRDMPGGSKASEKKAALSHGAKSLVNVIQMMVIGEHALAPSPAHLSAHAPHRPLSRPRSLSAPQPFGGGKSSLPRTPSRMARRPPASSAANRGRWPCAS